jgi:hypothetical protein
VDLHLTLILYFYQLELVELLAKSLIKCNLTLESSQVLEPIFLEELAFIEVSLFLPPDHQHLAIVVLAVYLLVEYFVSLKIVSASPEVQLLPRDSAPRRDIVELVKSHEPVLNLLEGDVDVSVSHAEEVEVVLVEGRSDVDLPKGKEIDETVVEFIVVKVVMLVELQSIQVILCQLICLYSTNKINNAESTSVDLFILYKAIQEVVISKEDFDDIVIEDSHFPILEFLHHNLVSVNEADHAVNIVSKHSVDIPHIDIAEWFA